MSLIHVKAAAGLILPKEGNPMTYITEAEPVEVEGTHYYHKAIADGDLVALTDKEWAVYLDNRAKSEAAAAAPAAGTSVALKSSVKDQPQ